MYKYIYNDKENIFICEKKDLKKCYGSLIFIDEENFFPFDDYFLHEINICEETIKSLVFKFGYSIHGFNIPRYVNNEQYLWDALTKSN